jgi:hypothetical protein
MENSNQTGSTQALELFSAEASDVRYCLYANKLGLPSSIRNFQAKKLNLPGEILAQVASSNESTGTTQRHSLTNAHCVCTCQNEDFDNVFRCQTPAGVGGDLLYVKICFGSLNAPTQIGGTSHQRHSALVPRQTYPSNIPLPSIYLLDR